MSQHITLRGGRFIVSVPEDAQFVFDFDPSQATFSRQGDDLLIQPAGGGQSRIEAFFTYNAGSGSSSFVMEDGTTLNGKDFFQVVVPDLVTAMGVSPESSPLAGHAGTYDDNAGTLIGGVGRLEALGAFDGATGRFAPQTGLTLSLVSANGRGESGSAPEGPPSSTFPDIPAVPDASADAGDDSVDPVVPAPPVGPTVPTDPQFRIVLYGETGAARQSGAAPLALNGADGTIVSVSDGEYGTARLLPDGSIVYTPAEGGPVTDSILVTLGDGSVKRIEVLVQSAAAYSAAEHADLGGEWHEGLIEGAYAVTATARNDVFIRQTGSTGLAAGSVMDMGGGDDILKIRVSAATGAAKGITGGTVFMGEGDDIVSIAASAEARGVYAYGAADGSRMDLGNGDNSMAVSVSGQDKNAYGLYTAYGINGAARTAVIAGSGNDSLDISVQTASYGAGVSNALVNLGEGDNRLNIAVQSSNGQAYGLEKAEITTGSGNDSVSVSLANGGYGISGSALSLGGGNNSIAVTGADTGLGSSTVTMGSGNDSIAIESTRSSSADKYGIVGYSSINTGAGDDTLRITLSGGKGPQALRTGSVYMGDGDDTAVFQVYGTSSAGGLDDAALLSMGNGNDTVRITVGTQGSLAFGLHNNSRVDLGDGNDSMTVDVSAGGAQVNTYAYGLAGSRINAGNGDDEVQIRASASTSAANGTAEADGVGSAFVDMGAGNDTLRIEAQAAGANAVARGIYALYDRSYSVAAGDGDNMVSLSAVAAGKNSALAVGIGNATFDAGAGNDSLDISVTATGGNAFAAGLQQALARMGGGNDTVHVTAHSEGDAYGITDGTNGLRVTSGTLLDLGSGDNTLSLDVHAAHNAYGICNSSLLAGEGNDSIDIRVYGENAYGLHGATVFLGWGDDHMSILAEGTGNAAALFNSSIDLGAGNDSLEIKGSVIGAGSILAGDGNDAVHIDGALLGSGLGLLVDMGGGDDLFIMGAHFSMNGQAALHGGTGIDTLKLDAGLELFDFSVNAGDITGFERLDLTDGAHEIILNLDSVRALTSDASGAGQGEFLRIFGNADDAVHLNGSGWSVDASHTVTLADANGMSHDFYAAINNGVTVYIEDQIKLDMLAVTG